MVRDSDKSNNQPHIIAIERDEYFLYMVAVKQSLMLECTEMATAIFMMRACHYVFNLSYHPKATDLFVFLLEKVESKMSARLVKKNQQYLLFTLMESQECIKL